MSRSNLDKPFYVDVGTSIAAVRCQSNRDVLDRFDHVRLGKYGIEMAEKMCDRMNAEVDALIAEKDRQLKAISAEVDEARAEIERLKVEDARLRVLLSGADVADRDLRALVGKLADALSGIAHEGCALGLSREGLHKEVCPECQFNTVGCYGRQCYELIAEAMEVAK